FDQQVAPRRDLGLGQAFLLAAAHALLAEVQSVAEREVLALQLQARGRQFGPHFLARLREFGADLLADTAGRGVVGGSGGRQQDGQQQREGVASGTCHGGFACCRVKGDQRRRGRSTAPRTPLWSTSPLPI